MNLHFYASIDTINGIQQGFEMTVFTEEARFESMILISVDLKKYDVKKVEDSKNMFLIKKKR